MKANYFDRTKEFLRFKESQFERLKLANRAASNIQLKNYYVQYCK